MGAVPGPFDSWLVLRGVKTLGLRMERHTENAMKVACYLDEHPKVSRVLYPGLPSFPGHELARKQMSGFGSMLSFYTEGGAEAAKKVCNKTRIFTLAESLGGVESLIEHPGIMTHASIPEKIRKERGLGDDLVRLSVGIEQVDDLLEDLEQALAG
jgi:cystathionine beta-lyase/cystathionine gamma-synthase